MNEAGIPLTNHSTDHCYDAAGNDTGISPSCSSYVYDAENHMTSGNGATYTYDADENRVRVIQISPSFVKTKASSSSS